MIIEKRQAKYLDSVVQSIASLTMSLVEKSVSLTILTKLIVVIFLPKKIGGAFASSSHFFQQKMTGLLPYNMFKKFNVSLVFEQLGPGC